MLVQSFSMAARPICFVHCEERECENLCMMSQTGLGMLRTWAAGRGLNHSHCLRQRNEKGWKYQTVHKYDPNKGGKIASSGRWAPPPAVFCCFCSEFCLPWWCLWHWNTMWLCCGKKVGNEVLSTLEATQAAPNALVFSLMQKH